MKESITKNILFTNQSSSQSSSRDNLIIGALKKKIKSLSRDLERKNEVIKEMRNQNEKTYHFNELYTENQKLKKEIVHLKELIIMNKGTDNNITNTCIDKNMSSFSLCSDIFIWFDANLSYICSKFYTLS